MELNEYRTVIDRIDREITRLFLKRMEVVRQIGAYKEQMGLPVYDPVREREKLDAAAASVPEEHAEAVRTLFETLFALSREQQRRDRENG